MKHFVIDTTNNAQWIAFGGRRMPVDTFIDLYGVQAVQELPVPIMVSRDALHILPEAAGEKVLVGRSVDSVEEDGVVKEMLPALRQAAHRRGLVLDEESVTLKRESIAGVPIYHLKGICW